jgi:phosphopantetheinyl transferase
MFEENTFEIMRTRENKPYLFSPQKEIGKWNYNVSHQGDVVCIASHPNLLIGIDVVDLKTRSNLAKSFLEYVQMFENILTNDEIKYLLRFPIYILLYIYILAK